ncbi:MAG: tetratricopeptide repeat protein [Acidobacteriaceae bacterium]|nr:tetratricopeptide repeat protein [Acidobacteriaceae bacterium]
MPEASNRWPELPILFRGSSKRKLLKRHPNFELNSIPTIRVVSICVAMFIGTVSANAADVRIKIPKRTKPTPVQKLNQEGVKALKRHRVEQAEKIFYKAYLIDPDDPFTLNNLGYVSELQGKLDRAERYYELAAQHTSDTTIAQSTVPDLKGQKLRAATDFVGNKELQINRGNIEAMNLLGQGRTAEAEQTLTRTLALDPRSPFTLNNLGYTMEAEGNLESALRYYNEAANLHSSDSIVVALDPHWRGKGISNVAENNARAVERRMQTENSEAARAARLNLEGVFALNRNQPQQARSYFEQAYKLDPYSPFSLNNMGYVSEMNGDEETADNFYTDAKQAPGAVARVSAASHSEMKGMALSEVANVNGEDTQANLETIQQARRRQGGPIVLRYRNNKPVTDENNPAPQQNNPQVPRPPEGQFPPPNAVPRPPQP